MLHTRIEGSKGSIPMVLCNGLFAALESWDRAMPYLQSCRVMRYDARGQGQSHKPSGPYSLEQHVEDLHQLMDPFEPAYFVGISNGGSVALAYAATYPEKVLGVVAADCHAATSSLLRLKLESWLKAHEIGGPTHRFDIAAPWIWSQSVLDRAPELISTYRERAAEQPDHAARALIEGAMQVQIPLERISAQVLLLTGEEDLLTPAWDMQHMQRRIRQATWEQVPGAHASLLEYPEIFGDSIVPKLKEWFDVV
jgi:3-oxoadipate enol-lactonase